MFNFNINRPPDLPVPPAIIQEQKNPLSYKSLKQRFLEKMTDPNFNDSGNCEHLIRSRSLSLNEKHARLQKAYRNAQIFFTIRMDLLKQHNENNFINSQSYNERVKAIKKDYDDELETLNFRSDHLLLLETSSSDTTPEVSSTPEDRFIIAPANSSSSSRTNSITFEPNITPMEE